MVIHGYVKVHSILLEIERNILNESQTTLPVSPRIPDCDQVISEFFFCHLDISIHFFAINLGEILVRELRKDLIGGDICIGHFCGRWETCLVRQFSFRSDPLLNYLL